MCKIVLVDVTCPFIVAEGLTCDDWHRPALSTHPSGATAHDAFILPFVDVCYGACPTQPLLSLRFKSHVPLRPDGNEDRPLWDHIGPSDGQVPHSGTMPCATHRLLLAMAFCTPAGFKPEDATTKDVSFYHPDEMPRLLIRDDAHRPPVTTNAAFERLWALPGGLPWAFSIPGNLSPTRAEVRAYSVSPHVAGIIPDYWGFDPVTKKPLDEVQSFPNDLFLYPRVAAESMVLHSVADIFAQVRIDPDSSRGVTRRHWRQYLPVIMSKDSAWPLPCGWLHYSPDVRIDQDTQARTAAARSAAGMFMNARKVADLRRMEEQISAIV